MTGVLKQTMEERADRLGGLPVDLDAVTREGDRRVRRRRVGGLAAGAVLAVALTGVALPQVLGGGPGDDGHERRGDAAVGSAEQLTWSEGNVIHHGDRATDVEHKVHLFVATELGFVSADSQGRIWSTTGDGTTQVGKDVDADRGRVLVADGSRAAWVEFPEGSRPAFAYLDQSTGDVTRDRAGTRSGMSGIGAERGVDETAAVFALDGEAAYVQDARGTVAVDLGSGQVTVLDPTGKTVIEDADDGILLHHAGNSQRTVVGTDVTAREPRAGTDGGDLSPDARFVMSENSATSSEDFTLLEVSTGKDFAPAQEADYGFFLGYGWSGADTYTAFGMQVEKGEPVDPVIDLLTCSASQRSCTVSERGLELSTMQFPIGEHVGG